MVAGLAEEAFAGPEHDREDDQPQLVDQVVLDERAPELIAGVDDDVAVQLLLQLRDLGHHVARQDRGVAPAGRVEGRGHDVLGQAVQPVRPLAGPGQPPFGEPLVAPPTQQQGRRCPAPRRTRPWPTLRGPCPRTGRTSRPARKPSPPSGSWTTPSSETFVLITIFPISVLLSLVLSATTDVDAATSTNWASTDRPVRGRGRRPYRMEVRHACGRER